MRPMSEENKAAWRQAISKTRAFLNDEEWRPAMADGAVPLTNEESRRLDRKLRGRPPLESPKQAVSLRLDQDVVEHFKRQGPGWQSRMNAALRKQAKFKT
jgi:uncharacterized protein (DUF4415 family)